MFETTTLQPDVFVIDYSLPGLNGYELFKQIKPRIPKAHFIVLSGNEDGQLVLKMIQAGIEDYVIKDNKFIKGLTLILNGEVDAYLDLLNED